jgi:RNA polymerase sigma-70 factor (ECF subfamily)
MGEIPPLDQRAALQRSSPIDWLAELERHWSWLRTVVRSRVGDWSAADDVLQNVSTAALRGPNRPVEPRGVAPWLYRVAVRQSLMHRRSTARRRSLVNRLQSMWVGEHDTSVDPLDWLMGRERTQAVREALTRLHPIDRDVFVLKHTENWTYQQLAERLGCSVHTIEHRLLKARRQLRKELAALGVTGASS